MFGVIVHVFQQVFPVEVKLSFLTYICWVFQIAMSYLSNYSIFQTG